MTGVSWQETFSGRLALGPGCEFNEALLDGQRASASLKVTFDDVDTWVDDPATTPASVTGTFTYRGLGPADWEVTGTAGIFVPADEDLPDRLHLRMRYELELAEAAANETAPRQRMRMDAFKLIENDPGFDSWSDVTTMFVRLYAKPPGGGDEHPLAAGVLRMTVGGFLKELTTFRGTDGHLVKGAGAVLRYQSWFLGRLVRTYAGPPINQTRPSFPVNRPHTSWGLRPDDRDWRQVPEQPALERQILPFAVRDLAFPLNVHHLRRAGTEASGDPVLLIPGSGVRANMFYGQPSGTSLAMHLLEAGFDVWVENWRASIDLPGNRYTLDQAAKLDHPAAIALVLEETGGSELRLVVHCQGSVSLLMTFVTGGLDHRVSQVVSSAVSLFVEVKESTWLKQRVAIPVVDFALPWMDAQWGLRSDTLPGWGLGLVAKATERPCGNPACQVANFMYGSGWDTLLRHKADDGSDWLDQAVHEWSARELGATPMTLIRQIADSSRYGHVVAARPHDPNEGTSYISHPVAAPSGARSSPCFTFIAGLENHMFHWQGQKQASDFIESVHRRPSVFVPIKGFGHLDTMWGREAPRLVFPVISDGLRWDGQGDSPLETAQARIPGSTYAEPDVAAFPDRLGRVPWPKSRRRRRQGMKKSP